MDFSLHKVSKIWNALVHFKLISLNDDGYFIDEYFDLLNVNGKHW